MKKWMRPKLRNVEGSKLDEKPAPQTAPTTCSCFASICSAGNDGQSSTVKASPLAKKIARDQKVDLSNVKGTGPGGRIVRKDIEAALASGQPSTVSNVSPLSIVHRPGHYFT